MTEQAALNPDAVVRNERLSIGALAQLPSALLTVDGISLAVMWCAIAVARLLPSLIDNRNTADAAVAIAALPVIAVLPHQIGIFARPRLRELSEGACGRLSTAEEYFVTWMAGLWLTILGLAVAVGVFGLPTPVATIAVLGLATLGGVYGGLRSDRITWKGGMLGHWPILAAALLVLVPLLLIRLNQPYPLQVGWGLFNYQYRILQFVNDDHIALVAGLHTPVHAGLLGVTALATGADPTGILWSEPLLQFLIYGFGVFLFAKALTKDNALSLLAVWVALWVLSLTIFQHLHAAGMRGVILSVWPWMMLLMYRQLPALEGNWRRQALHVAAAFGSVLVVVVIRSTFPSWLQVWGLVALAAAFGAALPLVPRDIRQSTAIFTLVGATITFFHAVEGPMFFLLGAGFVTILAWQPVAWQFRTLLATFYAVIVGFILLQEMDVITFSDPSMISRTLLGNDRADAIPIPFDSKMMLFKEGMTYPLMAILGWAAFRTLIWPKAIELAALATIAVAFGVYFVPESGLHRVPGPAIPLIGLVIALEVGWVADQIANRRWAARAPLVTGGLALAAMIALTPTLSSSLRMQVGLPSQFGFPTATREREFASILPQEYRAARWIADEIPDDWVMVSDPTTMFMMEGMTFRPQVIDKRRWVAESEYEQPALDRLRSVFDLVYATDSDMATIEGLKRLSEGHDGAVLIMSNRTLAWMADPGNLFPLGKPIEFLMDRDPIVSYCGYAALEHCPYPILENAQLQIVYNQDGIAVLVPVEQLSQKYFPPA